MLRTLLLISLWVSASAFSPSAPQLLCPMALSPALSGRRPLSPSVLSSLKGEGSSAPASATGSSSDISTLRPVILCPAQFGTAEDYEELKVDLRARGFALYPAPLSRFDWLKIVPSTLTLDFFKGELKPSKTLGFFYAAVDRAIQEVDKDFGPEAPITFLGHSIGGWVARSYIGEVLGTEGATRVQKLVTLGTPHNPPPPDSPMAAIDQTRGLLTYINTQFPNGAPLNPSDVTCVIGTGTEVSESFAGLFQDLGSKIWDADLSRSPLIEELLALSSYLPLSGQTFGVKGDGLIPQDTALIPECGSVVVPDCHHAGFIPTAGKSLLLPKTYTWYGSPEVIDAWTQYL